MPRIASGFLSLLSPSIIRSPLSWEGASLLGNVVLIAMAVVVLAWRLSSRLRVGELSVLLAIAAGCLLLLSIAAGRPEPAVLHYRFLLFAPVILAWSVVSSTMRRPAVVVTGLLLVGVYAPFYMANLDWRALYGREQAGRLLAVQADLFGRSSIEQFATEHINEFFFVDTEPVKRATIRGLRLLHREGIAPYDLLVEE